ncbi:YopX protein [compost metagenome]
MLGVYTEMDGRGYHKLHMTDFEIMWYTGLQDRNGKEIYVGDLVQTHDQNNVIEYDRGSFVVNGLHEDKYERTYDRLTQYLLDITIPDTDGSRYDGVTTTLKVIGNIHDNPSLLEAK